MKKTIISLFLLLPLLSSFPLMAQRKYMEQIKVENVRVHKQDGKVTLDMNIILDDLQIRSNDAILFSPVLRHSGSKEVSMVFPAVQVTGRTRDIVLDRMERSGVRRQVNAEIVSDVRRYNGKPQSIAYHHTVYYERWMAETDLVFMEVVHGCADCFVHEDARVLLTPFVSEPYSPEYVLTYITPDVEPVKARADRHTATFNFVVAKHDLLRDYKNNAAEFARVDRVVGEVVKNKDLTITEFAVAGYASPEGNFESNRALAGRRAKSFADYLNATYGVNRSKFTVTGYGEDWEGLKKALKSSSLPNKDAILSIISSTSNPDARDAKIVALDGGKTYNRLLQELYPPLRRTEYVIAYNVRAFDAEEAKEIIKTNPKLLSLNEMYLVARTYPADSREFKEVFDIATRLYPNEPVAIINASAVDIEGGNYRAAIDRLHKLGSNANALNNTGVAYARMGDLEKAKECFRQAADKGNADARKNLEELNKHIESL